MASKMTKRLEGKTIVVTGASSALEFARTSPKNLKLVLTARRLEFLKVLASEIQEEMGPGVQVLPVKLDVSKPDEVRGFVDSLPPEFKDIDILVNNAYAMTAEARGIDNKLISERVEVLLRGSQKRRAFQNKIQIS
ncbi:MAG: hypothetical protein Q9215_001349 [Flavoplaca cf. flavocitrina]